MKDIRQEITDRRKVLNRQYELQKEKNGDSFQDSFLFTLIVPPVTVIKAISYLNLISTKKFTDTKMLRKQCLITASIGIFFCGLDYFSTNYKPTNLKIKVAVVIYIVSIQICIYGHRKEQEFEDCKYLFLRSGIVDSLGDSVEILEIQDSHIIFSCSGISIKKIEERKKNLETALNLRIRRILPGNDHCTFILEITRVVIPKHIEFDDSLIHTAFHNKEHWLIGSDGETICLPLSQLRNILLNGACGSGKSVALRSGQTFLLIGSSELIEIYACDYKGGLEQLPFEPWLSAPVAKDDDLSTEIIDYIYHSLEYRLKIFANAGVNKIEDYRDSVGPMPRIIFVVDEYADLKINLELIDKDLKKKKEKAYLNKIQSCARRGRACGVHLIFCTQYSEAAILDSQTKNNMTSRQVMKMYSAASSRNLLEDDAAFLLPDIKGRHIFNDGGNNLEVQGFWLSESRCLDLLQRYGKKKLVSPDFLKFLKAKEKKDLLKQMQAENRKRLKNMRKI